MLADDQIGFFGNQVGIDSTALCTAYDKPQPIRLQRTTRRLFEVFLAFCRCLDKCQTRADSGGKIVTELPEDTALAPFHMLDQMLDNKMEVCPGPECGSIGYHAKEIVCVIICLLWARLDNAVHEDHMQWYLSVNKVRGLRNAMSPFNNSLTHRSNM